MKRTKRWFLTTIVLVVLATQSSAAGPFKKVSIHTSTTTSTTTAETPIAETETTKSENVTLSGPTKNSKLTGIPQIDYIWDPNLPRELRGYNLSSYPFFSTVPPEEDIHFKCDGLHDGFYASIEHKCQVYHHCVYGIRHDFLCANFTAFDQKTFICHFVSDVDCEGSQKYWSRNDALYMATTTTSTTTTTTEPPPTARRRPVRPLRPLRRPFNRRPADDYYYDEEDYDDEYYEERVNQRRKAQRPRHRKPQLEYDDEYEDKRSFGGDEKPRRPSTRDRFKGTDPEMEDDYVQEPPRKQNRPKARNKSNPVAERRKTGARRPGTISGRSGVDEHRSFADDKPINSRKDKPRLPLDDTADNTETNPRRPINGARRRLNNEKRPPPTVATSADIDDLDYYEKPQSVAHNQDEVGEDETAAKTKTTSKPLEEFVTPKASGTSVYARPRAPPRISRPVPVNERKKYEYPIQKTTATTVSPSALRPAADEYEEYEDYDETQIRPRAPGGRRRVVEDGSDDFVAPRRRTHNDTPISGRKPGRTTLRKPFTDKKSLSATSEDYEEAGVGSNERFDTHGASGRKRPYANRSKIPSRSTDDVDFVDDEYDDHPHRPAHRLRPKTLARKNPLKARPAIDEDEEIYESESEPEPPVKHRLNSNNSNGRHRTASNAKLRYPPESEVAAHEDDARHESDTDETETATTANKISTQTATSGRPTSVRVVKRPFLPSRGGSPYLPRGLQPVGVAHRHIGGAQTTDSTPIDMGSTISGVRLLEHGAPILRDSGNEPEPDNEPDNEQSEVLLSSPRTTLPPRSALPVISQPRPESQLNKATLDELYETDYDVTLNDALNPTLKPLSPLSNHHHQNNRNYASAYASTASGPANPFVNNNQSPAIYSHLNNKNNNQQNNHNNNNHHHHHDHDHNHNDNENQNQNDNYQQQPQQQQHSQHKQQHQIAYETLSSHQPISSSQSQLLHPIQNHNQYQHQHQHQNPHQHQQTQTQTQHQSNLDNFNSDSYFSSTDIRRRAIIVPAPKAHPNRGTTQYRGVGTRIAQHFYDDFDY